MLEDLLREVYNLEKIFILKLMEKYILHDICLLSLTIDDPPASFNPNRRRSRAVLYGIQDHYKTNSRATKLAKINKVSLGKGADVYIFTYLSNYNKKESMVISWIIVLLQKSLY